MAGELYKVLNWMQANGDVGDVDRLRVKVLPLTLKEKIFLAKVTQQTECSSDLLGTIRDAASELVGQPCPA